MEGAAAEVAAGESSGTDYASSDDGAMPFSNEDHTDHFGTFSQEGDSFAPLVETPLTAVRRMLEVAGLKRSDRLIDVGCGDGRIVVEAAEHFGCDAVGIDLFDDRLGDAANLAAERKVTSKTRFLQADAREFDFTGFDVVVVFLLPAALAIILPKLKQCLASGARVASYWFPVDGLMDDSDIEITSDPTGEIRVFVYTQKMPRTHGSSLAPDDTGGTLAGGSDGQQLQLKHTVTGERCTNTERASR